MKWIDYHYYAHFFLGVLPCLIGLGGQVPEFFDYMANNEKSNTPTFKVNLLYLRCHRYVCDLDVKT